MFELPINEVVYQFKFGLGFMREVDKLHTADVDGMKGAKQNVGLRFIVAGLIDKNPVDLVDALFAANINQKPRVTREALDNYFDECENPDQLFEQVLDFLKSANATKKTTEAMLKAVAEYQEEAYTQNKQEAEN